MVLRQRRVSDDPEDPVKHDQPPQRAHPSVLDNSPIVVILESSKDLLLSKDVAHDSHEGLADDLHFLGIRKHLHFESGSIRVAWPELAALKLLSGWYLRLRIDVDGLIWSRKSHVTFDPTVDWHIPPVDLAWHM